VHRPRPRSLALVLFLCAVATADARALDVDYFATVGGIGVGSAKLRANLDSESYRIGLSAKVGGLARLFADIAFSMESEGRIDGGALSPRRYRHSWRQDDDAETASIVFAPGEPAEANVDPPPRRPERRVPLTERDRTDALDLATAFVWPAPDGLDPGLCARTLPLFDGTQRFDLVLSFVRRADFETLDGATSIPSIVCAVRFHPVAGHRRDRDSVAFWAANEDMEIWMGIAGDHYAVPTRIRLRTQSGWFALQATAWPGR
jgi:hypothetical protein